MNATNTVATTDVLARQQGAFERCELVGFAPVAGAIVSSANPNADELTIPESCFNASHFLAQFEAVDGELYTLALSPTFNAYDNRLLTLQSLLENGFGWISTREELTDGIRDWDVVVTPTRERARQLNENGVPFGALTVSSLIRRMVHSFATVGGLFGDVDKRDRPSEIITSYTRQNYTGNLPKGRSDFEAFVRVAPSEAEEAEVIGAPSPNRLIIGKDGATFPLLFEGRVASNSHTPSELAKAIGVGTVKNLVDERVVIAPNVSDKLLSFNPVGTNGAGTFALGVSE